VNDDFGLCVGCEKENGRKLMRAFISLDLVRFILQYLLRSFGAVNRNCCLFFLMNGTDTVEYICSI
jgi:hypothetical protein